jgi:hypothetical protein
VRIGGGAVHGEEDLEAAAAAAAGGGGDADDEQLGIESDTALATEDLDIEAGA